MESLRVWFWGDSSAADAPADILEETGLTVRRFAPGEALPSEVSGCTLAVLDCNGEGLRLLPQIVRARRPDAAFPILYLCATNGDRRAALNAGADICLARPFAAEELTTQVRTLLRIGENQQRLLAQAIEARHLNRRLQQTHQRTDQDLEFAGRVQRSFLPRTLPEMPRTRLAVHHRPCGRIGGDSFDVFPIDENHLGFYLADALGHGVRASLLTMFIQQSIRSKDITGQEYRIVAPDEVLRRLNRALIEQQMLDDNLVTIVYGVLNFREGLVKFARAGYPPPLHVPPQGSVQQWSGLGPMPGVLEAEFSLQVRTLRSGDKVLWFSDGIDAAQVDGQAAGVPSLMACAARHRGLPVRNFVDAIAGDLLRPAHVVDDVTLLVVEWGD